ncbi:MAG: hypothetical protein HKO53_17170, partial [Gemmatimonadetes bacterium]|nr:hypothetical protein [Gemmatimonadota bacterium]
MTGAAAGSLAGQTGAGTGQVLIGGTPADSGTVVLHMVSPGFAGEVDSLPIGPGGRFALPLPAQGDSGVYFASVRVDGVLYFGSAIHDAADVDSLYTVQAYEGRPPSPGSALPVSVRNLFVEAADSGWTVTDLFEVENGGGFTVISGPGG